MIINGIIFADKLSVNVICLHLLHHVMLSSNALSKQSKITSTNFRTCIVSEMQLLSCANLVIYICIYIFHIYVYMYIYIIVIIFLAFIGFQFFRKHCGDSPPANYGRIMQNFDDLDIEGRNPSHLSEEDKEKVKKDVVDA